MIVLASFLGAVVVCTLLEYVVHRLMHAGVVFARRHAEHHQDGWGQGVLPELGTYLLPGTLVMLPAWLAGAEFGLGWTAGCLFTALWIAYAHQLQHEHPAACRWMRMPIHHVHHRHRMWHHNFGMCCDVWDRVFGTYRRVPVEFTDEERARGAFDLHWRRWEPGQTPARRRRVSPDAR